jgi:hypothetical protein
LQENRAWAICHERQKQLAPLIGDREPIVLLRQIPGIIAPRSKTYARNSTWHCQWMRLYGHVTTLLLHIQVMAAVGDVEKRRNWAVTKSAGKALAVFRMTTSFKPIPPKA